MTKEEAVQVMTDVATKRKPHSRSTVQVALAVLEPLPPSPKNETNEQILKELLTTEEARAAKLAEDAAEAAAHADKLAKAA